MAVILRLISLCLCIRMDFDVILCRVAYARYNSDIRHTLWANQMSNMRAADFGSGYRSHCDVFGIRYFITSSNAAQCFDYHITYSPIFKLRCAVQVLASLLAVSSQCHHTCPSVVLLRFELPIRSFLAAFKTNSRLSNI